MTKRLIKTQHEFRDDAMVKVAYYIEEFPDGSYKYSNEVVKTVEQLETEYSGDLENMEPSFPHYTNDRETQIKEALTEMLEELLSYGNQDGSFTVTKVDLENMKFGVEFDIVEVEEDGYVGFSGY